MEIRIEERSGEVVTSGRRIGQVKVPFIGVLYMSEEQFRAYQRRGWRVRLENMDGSAELPVPLEHALRLREERESDAAAEYDAFYGREPH